MEKRSNEARSFHSEEKQLNKMIKIMWTVFVVLFLSACGGGVGNDSPEEDYRINGVVNAPSGQVAYYEAHSFLYTAVDFVFSSAYADLLGLSPVPNAEVQITRIDSNGGQVGAVIKTTTTDENGIFSVVLSGSVDLSATLIAQVKGKGAGDNGKKLRAFIVSKNIVIDPSSEFIVREVLSSNIDIALVTNEQVKNIVESFNALDIDSLGNIEQTLASLTAEQQGVIDTLLETVIVSQAADSLGANPDTSKPVVSGAISKSNRAVLVTFSERMGISALEPSNYSVVLENVAAEAGGLSVIGAEFLDDRMSVLLQTSSQGALTYRVTVVNAKDLAGNALDSGRSGGGAIAAPTTTTFAGTAASLINISVTDGSAGISGWQDLNENGVVDAGDGLSNNLGGTQRNPQNNTFLLADVDSDGLIDNWQDLDNNGAISAGDILSGLLDSDLDGLLDNQESTGWTVTITQVDGTTVEREVTSDPLNADTDGDKLSDFEEFTNNADPRNTDTDGDSISDYDEWNVVFSDLSNKDSDGDGLPDLDEYKFYSTSPIVADSDGDGISDADELDNNRNPRIADRPKFSIIVNDVKLFLQEDYSYTDETGVTQTETSESSVTLGRDQSISKTATDSGVSILTAFVEASAEGGVDQTGLGSAADVLVSAPLVSTVSYSGGAGWSNESSWQTTTEDAQSSSEEYARSFSKGKELTKTETYTRNVTGANIQLSVDVVNQGDFTLSFSNIQISVHKKVLGALVPIATLFLPEGFGDLQISPLLDDDKGKNIIFANSDVPANLVEELMRDVPGLVFRVSNYTVVNNDGVSFANTDEDVFNRTAGIVFDYGDIADAERHLVSVAGSNDKADYVGGGWQGGIDANGFARGISLDYALQDILGMVRHYRYDTIEVGDDGVLNTTLDGSNDDVLDGNKIIPGVNKWIDTQPQGDDVLQSEIVDHLGQPTVAEQGIIAGPDRASASVALGDDKLLVNSFTQGIPYGTVLVSAGPNGVLDSVAGERDLVEYVGGYETSRTCLGNASTIGAVCRLDSDCNTDLEFAGSCQGPERIARINTLRAGDFNRDWFVFQSEDMPTSAEFDRIIIKPGQIFRLAFLQDLDRDGLTARTEALNGSIDSAVNVLDNRTFGKNFNFDDALAKGPNGDVFADSRDSDYDGLSDFAEIKVGWKINHPQLGLTQVFPHPGLADSDGDGLKDIEEMDLRIFCETDGSEWRMDGLCSFQNDLAVLKKDAVAIIAGRNGVADSVMEGDDDVVFLQGTEGLLYGAAVILPGVNELIDTDLSGDDQYMAVGSNVPSSHPRLKDTDQDNIDDFTELNGFLTAEVIVDGGDGIAQTEAIGDDISLVAFGSEMRPSSVMISSGVNGILDTPASSGATYGSGDDYYEYLPRQTVNGALFFFGAVINCGPDGMLDTMLFAGDFAEGDVEFGQECRQFAFVFAGVKSIGIRLRYAPPLAAPAVFFSNRANMIAYADDKVRPAVMVVTDPLRNDSDGDSILDGNEAVVGGNPTLLDSPDFRDADKDGLTDYVENKGWTVVINGISIEVTSDPTKMDSDGDGLPDLVEKDIGTLPEMPDSDGDGLTDYEEFNDFAKYRNYQENFDNFSLVEDAEIKRFDSLPTRKDSDNDGLDDNYEALTSLTNPLLSDTDGDGLSDYAEVNDSWDVVLVGGDRLTVSSSPLLGDKDSDGLTDKEEKLQGTDPNDANSDDDSFGINDDMELRLGTNPLDANDLCVEVKINKAVLNQGVNVGDDGGLIDSTIGVRLESANSNLHAFDDVTGNIDGVFVNKNNSQAYVITNNRPPRLLMKTGYSVEIKVKARYNDIGWTSYVNASATVKLLDFSVNNLVVNTELLTAIGGSIKITSDVDLTVLTGVSSGDCK